MSCILVLGGCGYIGSHTCVSLLEHGHDLIILDNLSNSSSFVINRISKILGISEAKITNRLALIKGDIRDTKVLENIFIKQLKNKNPIDSVFHFAGLKSVKESVLNPKKYWDINVNGTKNIIKVMKKYNCKTLIFSSSATIYGSSKEFLIPEDAEINPINPYGETKVAIEQLLYDLADCVKDNFVIKNPSTNGWRIARLRYFNPVGAHESGLIGEFPLGKPNNLFPIISQVATGKINSLRVFGNDWSTPDGSAIRDYVHVVDIAEGHYSALKYLQNSPPHLLTLNLGTGKGTSVIKVVKTFEKVINKDINYEIGKRRSGDSAMVVADVRMAKKYLNWKANKNLYEMCSSCIKWQLSNPEGYLND